MLIYWLSKIAQFIATRRKNPIRKNKINLNIARYHYMKHLVILKGKVERDIYGVKHRVLSEEVIVRGLALDLLRGTTDDKQAVTATRRPNATRSKLEAFFVANPIQFDPKPVGRLTHSSNSTQRHSLTMELIDCLIDRMGITLPYDLPFPFLKHSCLNLLSKYPITPINNRRFVYNQGRRPAFLPIKKNFPSIGW